MNSVCTVAHEMGHQYWVHQACGADMQGSEMTIEPFARYSALMVMEQEYGRDIMCKFLEYEMDRYPRDRGRERLKELPLAKCESQGYIHYNKGSDIGAFAKPESDKKYGKTLYRQRVKIMQKNNIFTFLVDEKPEKAGIDPFSLLIDREPKDNWKKVVIVKNRINHPTATFSCAACSRRRVCHSCAPHGAGSRRAGPHGEYRPDRFFWE